MRQAASHVTVTLLLAHRGEAFDVAVPAAAPLDQWLGLLAGALGLDVAQLQVVAIPSRPPAPGEGGGAIPLDPGASLVAAGVWDGSWLVLSPREGAPGTEA